MISRKFHLASFIGAVLVLGMPACSGNIPLPDGDGDGIPDLIDPCPADPDPTCVPAPAPTVCYDCDAPPTALPKFVPAREPIAGQYIVQLASASGAALAVQDVLSLAKSFAGVSAVRAFSPKVLSGFVAKITDRKALAALVEDKRVQRVFQDGIKRIPKPIAADRLAAAVGANLDRADQVNLPLNGKYDPAQDGTGVAIYVIDTGCPSDDLKTCRQNHPDFGPRLQAEAYSTVVYQGVFDAHGHGTHVSGTAGGTVWGGAKNVVLYVWRGLDSDGSGSDSNLIELVGKAIEHNPGPGVRKVFSFSWGGGPSVPLNEAICKAYKAGVVVVVAAGNESADSCSVSPSQVKQAITAGAADKGDNYASFSNYGAGVDLFSVGVDVVSDTPSGGTQSMSGTSMSTPIIAAAAALYFQRHPNATPAEVEAGLVSEASQGKLKGLPEGTPNRLLFVQPKEE